MRSLTWLLFLPLHLFGQNDKPYFQQEVNYTIAVALNDVDHTLDGNIAFEYINHSPDVLTEIWVHLWPNAYQDNRSAFCKQKLRDRDSKYYFSPKKDRGGFQKLAFAIDGRPMVWKVDDKNPDIAVLRLPKPLEPGGKTVISTPFLLKIPASFSRLGHVKMSYQITQWYPKPAVYDHKGWHAMPYLDIGEFFSEFGSFDVTLTLPDNYVVGATGVLQTPSEMEFLAKKEAETKGKIECKKFLQAEDFPPSSPNMKTIRYIAEKVHDFAWFADKRFEVLKDTARLASGRTVDCWAMFPSGQARYWEKGAFYVRRAVEFYSDKVGEYPYPHATAVHSALSAGGGMEYPMITVIGNSNSPQSLDDVIAHEVGHNWFYGILASNERDHPFLDEGLNSYYESRYMQQHYGRYNPVSLPHFLFDESKQGPLPETACLMLARTGLDTPPDSHSNEFSPMAYGVQAYMKTAMCLRWLEKSVGTERFDAAMQEYYRRWAFKHPYPEDLRNVMEEMGIACAWFFDAMRTQNQTDWKLNKIKPLGKGQWALDVKQMAELRSPFSVTALKNGQPIATQWHSPDLNTDHQRVIVQADTPDAFEIDWERVTLDLNRKNNFRRTSGLLPSMRPFEFRPFAPIQNSRRNTIAALPWAGWNKTNKLMLGIAVYNPPIPPRRFQYYVLPGYSFGSNTLVGLTDLQFNAYPNGRVKRITFGLSTKMFDYRYHEPSGHFDHFARVVPSLRLELHSPWLAFHHSLLLRNVVLQRNEAQFDLAGHFVGINKFLSQIAELRYTAERRSLPNPYRFNLSLESQQRQPLGDQTVNYLKISAEWTQKFYYQTKKNIAARIYFGGFAHSNFRRQDVNPLSLTLNPQGFNDYVFDETFAARTGEGYFWAKQMMQGGGGFKGHFGPQNAQYFSSNSMLGAVNLRADLPFDIPLLSLAKPYFDIGYFNDATQTLAFDKRLLWNGGLAIELFNGGLEFYFPLLSSPTLRERYGEQAGSTNPSAFFRDGNYFKNITWSMRLRFNDPIELAKKIF